MCYDIHGIIINLGRINLWLGNIPEPGSNARPVRIGLAKGRPIILRKELPLKAQWQKGNAEILADLGKERISRQALSVTVGKSGLF